MTLYCLVCGRVPFHDSNIIALYNKVRTQPFDFPDDRELSPELKDLIERMLAKDPARRITLGEVKVHDWTTGHGVYPLASEEENCMEMIEVTDSEVDNSIRSVPKLDTLILVKSMIKNHSFTNPFSGIIGGGGGKGGNPKGRKYKEGRSNSAPEFAFCDTSDRYVICIVRLA